MKFIFFFVIKKRFNDNEKILSLDKNIGYEFIEKWCYGKAERIKFIIKAESKYEINKYIAIDNSENKCIVEDFKTISGCEKFLLEGLSYDEVVHWEIKKLKKTERMFFLRYYIIMFFVFIVLFLFSNYIMIN